MSEVERDKVLAEVVETLEDGYAPQNPSTMHPADFITKRFRMEGHENLRYTNAAGAVERVIADDEAMRRARHAYLNSPPHGVHHTDAARLEHMRAAFRAAFEGQ